MMVKLLESHNLDVLRLSLLQKGLLKNVVLSWAIELGIPLGLMIGLLAQQGSST